VGAKLSHLSHLGIAYSRTGVLPQGAALVIAARDFHARMRNPEMSMAGQRNIPLDATYRHRILAITRKNYSTCDTMAMGGHIDSK